MVATPPLIACAHGTRDPSGRETIDALRDAVAAARPGVEIVEAYVDGDVQAPALAEALAGRDVAVVVPVLLSAGYHVHVDIPEAVAGASFGVVVSRPLGPDPVLAGVLADRLAAGAGEADEVVLAAAGSSDPRAAADVEKAADLLAERTGRAVTPAYATAGRPPVEAAVAALRAAGGRVAVAAYVLAPGHFHDRLRESGADVVTAPLLPDVRIAGLVLDRYDEALVRSG